MARACKRAHSQNTVMNMAAAKSVIRARPQPVVRRPKKIRDAKRHQMYITPPVRKIYKLFCGNFFHKFVMIL